MRQKSFYYFLFIIVTHGLLSKIIGYFMPIYFNELGFTGVQTGTYIAVSSIASIVLALPMGISTDRKSISGIFMLTFCLMGLSYVGFLISKSFLVFCAFALLGSFGNRLYNTAKNTMFFKLSGADNRREAGLFNFSNFVAMGLGMILGGFIIQQFSFRAIFQILVLSNGAFMILARFLPRTETVVIELAEYRKILFTPEVLLFTLIFSLYSFHWGAEMVSYTRFLKESLGLSITQTGLYSGVGFIVVGFGALLGMKLLESGKVKDLQQLFVIGLLLAGVFQCLMTVHNLYWSFGLRMVHEIGDGFVFLIFYHGAAKVFNLDKIGGCVSFIAMGQAIATFISAIVFGYVSDTLSHEWSLILSGLVLLFAAGLLYANRRVILRSDSHVSACSTIHA